MVEALRVHHILFTSTRHNDSEDMEKPPEPNIPAAYSRFNDREDTLFLLELIDVCGFEAR